MSKTLLLILAFGAVAFAAPSFAPQSNEEINTSLTEPEINEQLGADDQNVEVHNNIEKGIAPSVVAASADNLDENIDKRSIAKRQAYVSYPYSQYRYGYYPNRYGYYPEQPYYEPAANGRFLYPYRNLPIRFLF